MERTTFRHLLKEIGDSLLIFRFQKRTLRSEVEQPVSLSQIQQFITALFD